MEKRTYSVDDTAKTEKLIVRTLTAIRADSTNPPTPGCSCAPCSAKMTIMRVAMYFPEELTKLVESFEPRFEALDKKIQRFYENDCEYSADDTDLQKLDEDWADGINVLIRTYNEHNRAGLLGISGDPLAKLATMMSGLN